MASRWADIERLYHAVRERAPQDRAAFLSEACAGDDALRQEIESLLVNETAAGGFLEGTALNASAQNLAAVTTASAAPPSIPGYTILKTLGEGGMGVVYLAEQVEPIRRFVALKLIRHGMDSRHVVARFEAERQALALMHHPHIAAVFDAGTTADGRPYFVMEYVEGVPITDYCDRQQLSTRARLELFVQVCAAVQHAHQKGVIHRDLKPSNILVSEQDGQPRPKVIDFGIAKAVDSAVTVRTAFTDLGMMVGTPEYMSPEQAALSSDIDTATDVYSLGVVLYELLAGALPFDPKVLRAAGYDEMRRIIRESDPPKPSTRLTGSGESRVSAAAARKTDASRLARELRGDLDLIALKALQKDRHRRYDSIATFAADVGRYLADEPIAARPPSAAYRVRKFTRRYRTAVMGTAAAFVVLIAGLVSTILYVQAEGQRRVAEEREYGEYVATIAAADGEVWLNLVNSARARLLGVPAQLRGWEWHHLLLKTDPSLATLTSNAPCPGLGAALTTSTDNVLSVSDDGLRLHLRRCETFETWEGPARTQSSRKLSGKILAISLLGEALVVVTEGTGKNTSWRLRLIQPETLKVRAEFGPFHREPICAAIDRRTKAAAVGTMPPLRPMVDGKNPRLGEDAFSVFSTETGREIARLVPTPPREADLRNFFAPSCMVAFSPDSKRLATSGAMVHVWQPNSGSVVAVDDVQAGHVSQPIAWSADSERLAIGRQTGLVDILDLRGTLRVDRLDGNGLLRVVDSPVSEQRGLLTLRKSAVFTIAFAPDGQRIVTGTEAAVGVWDVAQHRLVELLAGHSGLVVGAAFEADGGFVTADTNGHVKHWNAAAPGAKATLSTIESARMNHALVISADGSTAAAAQFDHGLSVWRLGDLHRTFLSTGADSNRVWPPTLSPDGRQLVALLNRDSAPGVETSMEIRTWDVATGTSHALPWKVPVDSGCFSENAPQGVNGISISPDGRSAAHRYGSCLVVRDVATWSVRAMRVNTIAESFLFRPDGALLFLNLWRRPEDPHTRIAIWDWKRDHLLSEILAPSGKSELVRISPDGRIIAHLGTKGETATLTLWDEDLRHELPPLLVPAETRDVAFSWDGGRLASIARDGVIRIWDVERRQFVLALSSEERFYSGFGFTPDGKLVAGRSLGGLTIWDTKPRDSLRAR